MGYHWAGEPLAEERQALDHAWEQDRTLMLARTECPTCGASNGQRCHDPHGHKVQTHRSREVAADLAGWPTPRACCQP